MRRVALLIFLASLSSATVVATDAPAFKHHTFEFALTPAFDYQFVTWPNRSSGYKQQVNNLYRPLAGINVGAAYIYRPIYYAGISTGFNFLSFNNASNFLLYAYGVTGHLYQGYMSVPLLIHAYYPLNNSELELATGPEFLFPLYVNTSFNTQYPGFTNQKQTFSASQTRANSWLAYTVQICANIPVKKIFIFSVGPEIKFLPIYPLKPGPYYNQLPHQIDYYVGIKLGFRWGSDFKKKTTKPVSKT